MTPGPLTPIHLTTWRAPGTLTPLPGPRWATRAPKRPNDIPAEIIRRQGLWSTRPWRRRLPVRLRSFPPPADGVPATSWCRRVRSRHLQGHPPSAQPHLIEESRIGSRADHLRLPRDLGFTCAASHHVYRRLLEAVREAISRRTGDCASPHAGAVLTSAVRRRPL